MRTWHRSLVVSQQPKPVLIKESPGRTRPEAEFGCSVRLLTGVELHSHMLSMDMQMRVQLIAEHDSWAVASEDEATV